MPFCDALTTRLAPLAGAAEQPTSVLERLDPPTRAVVLMALLGLVLLGLGMVALTMIGGRWVRRLARQRPPVRRWPKRKDFEPPAPGDRRPLPGDPSTDTLPGRRSGGDTVNE